MPGRLLLLDAGITETAFCCFSAFVVWVMAGGKT